MRMEIPITKVIIETRTFGFERITSKVVVPEKLTRKAASACETALQAQDYKRHYAENATFHTMIYEASGNGFLAEEAANLHQRLKPFLQAQLSFGDRLFQSMMEHREILLALEAGNAARADSVMRDHIRVKGSIYEEYRQSMSGEREVAGRQAP
jgi:DNA-binding GntR family transcriptional regulator